MVKKIVAISLEPELIEKLDHVWRTLGYKSRSDLIGKAAEDYLTRFDLTELNRIITDIGGIVELE